MLPVELLNHKNEYIVSFKLNLVQFVIDNVKVNLVKLLEVHAALVQSLDIHLCFYLTDFLVLIYISFVTGFS